MLRAGPLVPERMMYVDFHTHSTASDGSLAPADLIAAAGAAGVEVLSITDHDTLAAYAALPAIPKAGPAIVTGVEFSTEWQGCGIHVLGLNVAPQSSAMREAGAFQRNARERRAERIAERLARAGAEEPLAGARAHAGDGAIGRPHFARHLVATGFVKDVGEAFRKFLGAGKIGDVKQHWAPLERIIEWIRDGGGTAVLAHPARYGLTRTRRNALTRAFAEAGGRGIEVISGRQDPALTATLALSAKETGLLASCGSDFHHPNQPWSRLGMPLKLPSDCRPVWENW